MNRESRRRLCVVAVALLVQTISAYSVNVAMVEADGSIADGIQYAPVNFAGVSPVVSGGITYYALSDPGSATISSFSSHASTVRDRLLAADGINNPVNTIYALYAADFINSYVNPAAASTTALRPGSFGSSIKIVNHSWVGSAGTTALNLDSVRRMDYMIWREDLVMVSGAVARDANDALTWPSRNGIAVRGTQSFNPALIDTIGRHADLWGPKTGAGADEAASFTTPGVSGYAAGLIDLAAANGWNNGLNGLRHEVVKSVLMTGADKTDFSGTTGGFSSWTNNGINNLDNLNGAGRANYDNSVRVLAGGQQAPAAVSGTTITSPTIATALSGWWHETSLGGGSAQALVLDLTALSLTGLTASLTWDVTQQETQQGQQPRLNTTDTGVIFANFDLELRPVSYSAGTYTIDSSLGMTGLISQSTNDNVEHLYVTGVNLNPGYYALVVDNKSDFSWNYGLSYDIKAIPEPGVLSFLILAAAGLYGLRQRKINRRG